MKRSIVLAVLGLLLAGDGWIWAAQPRNPRDEKAATIADMAGEVAAAAEDENPCSRRATELEANVKTFRLELAYHGEEDKPFYRLVLHVEPIEPKQPNSFFRYVKITEKQATKIIDYLGMSSFLAGADDANQLRKLPPGPLYLLRVRAGDRLQLGQNLGWGLPMLKRMDELREVLKEGADGDAAKGMDLLLGRLSGLRQQWEKEAKAKKPDPNEDYARYVHVGVIDPKQAGSVGKLLEDHGIPNIIEGSVAYGVTVPPEKKERAAELLKADAAKRGYWLKLSGE